MQEGIFDLYTYLTITEKGQIHIGLFKPSMQYCSMLSKQKWNVIWKSYHTSHKYLVQNSQYNYIIWLNLATPFRSLIKTQLTSSFDLM